MEYTGPLRIDPECLQDALRAFFQPIKTDNARADFYNTYKRESTDYDADYIRKCHEDLNTSVIFAGLFSAVSSTFITKVNSGLQPDPNEQSAALLRAILLTLNNSPIPDDTPAQENPSDEAVAVACLMYASLLISLFAAFIAMLGKQWLNRYSRRLGNSMIERCGDRQRKFNGLEKWPLHFFIESLPLILQLALLLIVFGISRYMWSINTTVAYILISIACLGIGFYVGITVVGMTSYACPFQTPASAALRGPWKKVQRAVTSSITYPRRAFSSIYKMWSRRVLMALRWQSPSIMFPLEDVWTQQPEPWLHPKDLSIIRRANTNDVQCVSWILRNITDPEALDAAIRLAGEIRWFDDGINVGLPYDLIVSTFDGCFDLTGRLLPGSRDRAYYSGRAMTWIQTLAMCKSEEFAGTFLLQHREYTTPAHDSDLRHLLAVINAPPHSHRLLLSLGVHSNMTPSHTQWISDVMLHLSWADGMVRPRWADISTPCRVAIPLNATLNRLLAWCIFLGSPVEEAVLEVKDKSNLVERILRHLSKAALSAINGTNTEHESIPHILCDLIGLRSRPLRLTAIAYEWCSAICENRQRLQDWESLLLLSLEIGFRHLDPERQHLVASLKHTEHHRELVDVVFKGQDNEAIADLLCAWTTENQSRVSARTMLGLIVERLVDLPDLVPFSARLRRLVIRSVGLIGYEGFEGIGAERLIKLLNYLEVTSKDTDDGIEWATFLSGIVQTREGAQSLAHQYWELLLELSLRSRELMLYSRKRLPHSRKRKLHSREHTRHPLAYDPQIMTFLYEAQEWSKLECWMAIVWIVWPPKTGVTTEEDLYHSMLLLFSQRPDASQKLEQRMEQWIRYHRLPRSNLMAFQRLCKRAHEVSQRDMSPSNHEEIEEVARTSPP